MPSSLTSCTEPSTFESFSSRCVMDLIPSLCTWPDRTIQFQESQSSRICSYYYRVYYISNEMFRSVPYEDGSPRFAKFELEPI